MTDDAALAVARLIDVEYDRLDERIDELLADKHVLEGGRGSSVEAMSRSNTDTLIRKIDDELSTIYYAQAKLRQALDELFPIIPYTPPLEVQP